MGEASEVGVGNEPCRLLLSEGEFRDDDSFLSRDLKAAFVSAGEEEELFLEEERGLDDAEGVGILISSTSIRPLAMRRSSRHPAVLDRIRVLITMLTMRSLSFISLLSFFRSIAW